MADISTLIPKQEALEILAEAFEPVAEAVEDIDPDDPIRLEISLIALEMLEDVIKAGRA